VKVRGFLQLRDSVTGAPRLSRLAALQSFVDIEVAGLSGSLLPPRTRRFLRPGGLPPLPVPVPSRVRFHPLLSFTSSSEHYCLLPARCPRATSASFRVCFPFATSARGVHSTASSHARLGSALSVSHALDGLLLHAPCRLVSSCNHVRDSLSRGFPRCLAGPSHRRPVPSCRFSGASYRRVAPPAPEPPAPTPGLCSGQRSVVADRRVRPANHSIPSWAFNSCGLFSEHLGDALTPPPLMTSPPRAHCPPGDGLQRVNRCPT
jgi:hypothetical protein